VGFYPYRISAWTLENASSIPAAGLLLALRAKDKEVSVFALVKLMFKLLLLIFVIKAIEIPSVLINLFFLEMLPNVDRTWTVALSISIYFQVIRMIFNRAKKERNKRLAEGLED
jgi:hypothetical protein